MENGKRNNRKTEKPKNLKSNRKRQNRLKMIKRKTGKRKNGETKKRRNLKSIRIGEKREIEEKAEKWKHGKGENDDKRINRKNDGNWNNNEK